MALRAASLHPRTRPSFCMSLRTSARWNRGAPVRPGEGDAVERLKPWLFRRKSRGEGCVACIAEVWQSVLPAGKPGRPVLLRANSQLFRIRREELLFGLCCRRSYGLPRRFAPRNDMQKLAACSHSKDALPGQIPTRLCIHPAAPLCTRRSASVFCIPSRQTPLATADALLPSAWHCAPRPCNR